MNVNVNITQNAYTKMHAVWLKLSEDKHKVQS